MAIAPVEPYATSSLTRYEYTVRDELFAILDTAA
jgi:hypothetical protein